MDLGRSSRLMALDQLEQASGFIKKSNESDCQLFNLEPVRWRIQAMPRF